MRRFAVVDFIFHPPSALPRPCLLPPVSRGTFPSHEPLTFATAKSGERRNLLVPGPDGGGNEPLVRVLASDASFAFAIFPRPPPGFILRSFVSGGVGGRRVGPGEIKNIYFCEKETRSEGPPALISEGTHLVAVERNRMSKKLAKVEGLGGGVGRRLVPTLEMYRLVPSPAAKGSWGREGWERTNRG